MNEEKLEKLAEIEGYSNYMDMLGEATNDSIAKGICTNVGCDYTTDVEPDSDGGWCEECNANTVHSCLILAGVI